jgi:quinol monooxygenase YgiN
VDSPTVSVGLWGGVPSHSVTSLQIGYFYSSRQGAALALFMLLRPPVVRLSIGFTAPRRTSEQLARAMRVLTVATRVEAGCLSCRLWTDLTDDCDVHYEERWRNEDAMRRRILSEGFTKLLEVLEASPTRPTIEFDFVSRHLGLEYIESIRRAGPELSSK